MEMRQYNVADPHAPRFRPKRFDILKPENVDFFSAMKKQYPELEKYSNNDIANCIWSFNTRISQEIIDNRNGVRLPDGLGVAVAGACKLSKEAAANNIDYGLSDSLQVNGVSVKVPHQNLHSDTYIAKVKYSNEIDRHMFENHHMWCFDPCRKLARSVSAEFKKGNHRNYIIFTSFQRVISLFRKPKIQKDNSGEKKEERLKQHDEFAF